MSGKEDPSAKSLRVWEKMAPTYDKGISFWERRLLPGGREWVCSRAQGRVLEVAIGTGRNLPFYPSDVDLVGVELSPAMLAIAGERAAQLDRKVELHEGNAHALPFADTSFDTVVCALSLCAIADDKLAIAEMVRVLRPGGRLLLLDHVASSWWPIHALQKLTDLVSVPMMGEHQARQPLPLVKAAGLEIVEVERRKAGVAQHVHARKPA